MNRLPLSLCVSNDFQRQITARRGGLSAFRSAAISFHTRRRESAVTALAAEATAKLRALPLERVPSLAL